MVDHVLRHAGELVLFVRGRQADGCVVDLLLCFGSLVFVLRDRVSLLDTVFDYFLCFTRLIL